MRARVGLTNFYGYDKLKLMRRITLIIFFTLYTLHFTLYTVEAYWIWTPETGRWINPKREVKPVPKEQLDYALEFYNRKDYNKALREFNKLINKYPKSYEAAEAQFYIGACLENQGKLYEAYKAYQKVIDKYPFSERIDDVIQKQFDIAEAFISGRERKVWGILPLENPAIEILNKVIENSPYGPLAPQAQYKLGLVLKSLGRYFEAEEAFEKLISKYPQSEWVKSAKYQIAICLSSISPKADYAQDRTEEARKKFEEFVKLHPKENLSFEAEKKISKLKEKEAEANFKIASFYEKQKDYQPARIYYKNIIENYPETTWAAKSLERLKILERKK